MARPFMSGYKVNPGARGDPGQWRAAFRQRLTGEEIKEALGSDTPWDVFSVPKSATWDEIKKAYRAMCREWHPDVTTHDKAQAEAMMKKINAAYQELEDRHVP